MYSSLGKVYGNLDEKSKKKIRGLVNVVESALHTYTLFGVCDDNCIQETTDVLKEPKTEKKDYYIK